MSVHDVDFAITEPSLQLDSLRAKFSGQYYINSTMIGLGKKPKNDVRILNTISRFTPEAAEYDSDALCPQ